MGTLKVRRNVYDTYWQTAAERQEIFFKKLLGAPPPLTNDYIFQNYKFCNVYRASDRVSQFLIRNVIYSNHHSPENTLFRIFLFRLLNKIETWVELEKLLGEIQLNKFSFDNYCAALEQIKTSRKILYGNAFILCASKAFGYETKHKNHLALLKHIFKNNHLSTKILNSKSLKVLFEQLKSLPLIGNFMAYQISLDLNYSDIFSFDENDFTVAGPGAKRGIQKCFIQTGNRSDQYIINFMVENQEAEFNRLGLDFKSLWGRPMHAIDCQSWFCETDKYSRVKFPQLKSNRSRIKTHYKQNPDKIDYFFPPKWNLIIPPLVKIAQTK